MKKALRRLVPYWPVMLLLWPTFVLAQGLVPCGNSSDLYGATSCDLCSLGQLIQNVTEFLVISSIPIAAALFCIAGYHFFTSGGSSTKIEKGKHIVYATMVGLIIVLAAWLIVQTIIVGLVSQGFYSSTGGFWNQLSCVNSTNTNLRPRDTPISSIFGGSTPGANIVPGSGKVNYGNISQCIGTNTSCNTAALQQVGFSPTQAAVMSCIAMTESSGNPNTKNSPTGACGLFQITQGNWNNSAYHSGSCSSASSCNNAQCNAQTAYLMFQQSGYQPWSGTCNNPSGCGLVSYGQQWNPNASKCINQYGGGSTGPTTPAAALESLQQ